MSAAASIIRYRVEGMDCPSCVAKIETAVSRISGVGSVSVSLANETMSLTPLGKIEPGTVESRVEALGFDIKLLTEASPAAHGAGDPHASERPWYAGRKARLTLACAAALALAYAVGLIWPVAGHWAFLAAMLIGLVPIGTRAVAAARTGTPFSIEMLMSIAAIGAIVIGAVEEAAVVVVLFLIGELLEGVAASRARASIRDLADLVPKTAIVEEGSDTREIPASSLTIGNVIRVRPGDRIAADGDILEGSSTIDEAPVTGESVPKPKTAGDAVFAGTINTDAVLRIRVSAAASDNTIARVIRLVEEAQETKAPTQRFIDRFSTYYTPAVLVMAILVAVIPPLAMGAEWSNWIYRGLAVLLIGCPCALVISTPAAIAAGLSAGARRGLLLKGGSVLEDLKRITTVALDKTGTLTEGRPQVTDIVGVARSADETLALAAALEAGSSHPLARAILARANDAAVALKPVGQARALAGKGVAGTIDGVEVVLASPKAAWGLVAPTIALQDQIASLNDDGKTVSVLVIGSEIAGLIAMRDEPRADAKIGLAALQDAGIETIMLTGDNERTAAAIGRSLGIEVRAGLLPQDKQVIVKTLQDRGAVVAKVGDGINDAPALAAANIGIAMGGGTDVALETADAAILHGRVADLAAMIDLSKSTMGNITQNIVIALGLKAVFLVTTIAGYTGLWPAILADTGATVLVTLNAMRLLRWQPLRPSISHPSRQTA